MLVKITAVRGRVKIQQLSSAAKGGGPTICVRRPQVPSTTTLGTHRAVATDPLIGEYNY